MKTRWKLFAVVLAILAGTWLLMAGAGGVRYVGNFTGNGAGLTNIPQAGVVQLSNSLYYLTNAATGGATGILILNGYGTNTTLIGTPHIGAGNIITNLVGSGAMSGNGGGLTNIPQSGIVQLSNSLFYLTNSAAAGIATLNGFGTNTTLRNPTLAGIVTNTAPLLMTGTITKTNYTTGAWAVESAAGWQLGVTNGGTPTVNVVGSSGAISTVGPVAASLFTGNGQGLTNINLVNALSVGATGDGTTDDTAALQAAFNITTNGIWLPPGTYLITNTLVLKGFPHIVGSGIQNTFIKAGAGGADTGLEGGNMIQLATYAAGGAMNGGLLRDFSVDGSGIAANGVVVGGGAAYTNATGHMEDMEVKWCTNSGVLVLASQEFHIMNSSLSYNYNGIYSTTNTVGSDHSTTLYVDHCKIQANTNCGVYLNYAHTFRFRDNVIQGSGGPGVWFDHGGQLLSWAFVDVLFSGNYFEQNNITAAYRQVGQVRMDTHATYPADKIVFENNYFNSPGGNITTNFFYIGPAYAVLRDNYFAPAWGCITVSNATTVSIMGSSVDTGTTDETGGLGGPDVYFANTTTALPANPNISWTYIGQTNSSEKLISPKRYSIWVNNGDGHLVPVSMMFGSTTGAGATAWFPSVIATNLSVSGSMALGTLIVTNPPALDLQSSTNLLSTNVVVDASGFDGNLATTDTNIQQVAQAVDDLVLGGATGLLTNQWTTNVVGDEITGLVKLGPLQISGPQTNTATGTIWNSDGTRYITNNANGFGVGAAAPAGVMLYSSGVIAGADAINAAGNVQVGLAQRFQFATTGTRIYQPQVGGLRITDSSAVRDRYYINGTAKTVSDGSATDLITITGRTNSFVGGKIDWTVFASDGTEQQTVSGTTLYSGINTNGVWAVLVATNTPTSDAIAVTSGTLTTVWSAVADTGHETTNVVLQVTADSSLTPTSFYILWQLHNNGTNAITAL